MEKQASSSVVCPVCSLFLREGISLKNHLQTHSKEKVIEALLKQDPLNTESVESNVDLASNNSSRDSTSVSVAENRVFGLNRSTVGVLSTTSTFVEPSNNQLPRTTPSITYDSSGVQCVNGIQFPSSLTNSLIGQPNVTNACNAYSYHQFITSDGNIVLIPVYNVGPTSVIVPNNIVTNSLVNPCVVVPQNPVQSIGVVNPPTLAATDVFSSSIGRNDESHSSNVQLNESNSSNDTSSPPTNNSVNTTNSTEDDEKETDDEVANIFDQTLRSQQVNRKRPLDVDEDDKSSCLSVTSDLCSSPDDDIDINATDNVELEGRNELIPSAAVSVIRVRSDLNYESDGSPFHMDEGDEHVTTPDTECTNSSNEQFSPVARSSTDVNVKCDALSSQTDPSAQSSKCNNRSSTYDDDNKNSDALVASGNQNEYDFVISNSDNAMHILPDTTEESLNCAPRRDNDQYILPNDEIPGNCSFNAGGGSDYNFLGIRNSFLSSVSLISSVNKTMFADVDVYNSVKNQTNVEAPPGDVVRSNLKNEELSVIVKSKGTSGYRDEVGTDEALQNVSDRVESAGSSRISPFNIQTDESMPPRGELSGQESLSGNENSLWELQMQQRSKNFENTYVGDNKDVKLGLHSIIEDVGRAKGFDTFTNKDESAKKESEVTLETVSSGSGTRKKRAVQREFICFYCRTKFDSWKQRQRHIAEKHSEEDGLTIESLFGKRLKCKLESVKEEEEHSPDSKDDAAAPDCIICRICNDSFQTSIALLKHLKVFHGIKKRSCVCPTCFVRFATADEYQQHIQKVHPYECMTCGKKFYTRPGYMLHQKRHMKVKPYSCNDCDKSFVTKQKLAEHVNIHTGENPIKCELCDCQFKRYSNYQQHKKYLHLNHKRKVKDFVCDCGEVFHSKVKLLWHQEIHDEKPKQCPFCVERFVHAASLTRHVRKWHNETYVSEWATKKKMKNLVPCPICNVTYLHSSLQTHMKIHEDVKPFACTECSRSFRTKWNLQLHKWTHMSRSSKPFKCKLCVKAYIHKTDYDAHVRSHNNCRPYACNVCGRQFIRKYNCIRHMREHMEPRAYKCDVCGKLFSRSYYLTEHEKVHTGEKPHVCHICGKSSATKSNHNKHVKMHNVVRESINSES